MKTTIRSTFKVLLLSWFLIQTAVAQPEIPVQPPKLKIHQNEHWRAMLEQWFILKYTTPNFENQKITLEFPELRIDLTMQDLIDQVNHIIVQDFSETDYANQLNKSIESNQGIKNFENWYIKLNELASLDERFQNHLDRKLVIQEYNRDGVALTEGIGMFRLKRIRLLEKYNQIAIDPEGAGILSRLSPSVPLTVLSANDLRKSEIKSAKDSQYESHYQEMMRLEALDREKYADQLPCIPRLRVPRREGKAISVSMCEYDEIFNALEKLPSKNNFTQAIDAEMGLVLPRSKDGQPVLTPSYLLAFSDQLIPIVKDLTWRKQLSREDDETLLLFRKWLKRHREETLQKLIAYNQSNGTELKLDWLNEKGMPRRTEVIESYEILRVIYQEQEPWQDEITTVMRNKRGNEVVVGRNVVGTVIRKVGIFMRNLVKTENLAGIAAGTGTFFLTSGNLPLAMMANSVTHDVVVNRKYDRNPRELLTQIPNDVLAGALTQTGFQPGRIFNVLALGAGSGFIQGITTRQNPLKSTLVGATTELGLEFLPANIRYPLVSGVSQSALDKNTVIEVFTTSAKTAFRGGVVAIWEKQDVLKGLGKGAIYGTASAVLKIVVLGVRYDPLEGYSEEEVQFTIDEENTYANLNGAPGGNYQISKETIQKTPYRTGGWLPVKINASITLPGNVSIHPGQMGSIETVVHESLHLSQQEQFGLINFYFQYIMEASTTPYKEISFEISAH
jgi:hypothetical protein